MKWLTLTVVAWMSFVSLAAASLAPPRKSSRAGKDMERALATRVSAPVANVVLPAKPEPEFAVTSETEILLDGKPCAYEAVPANASIIRMEVAPDKKTVRKILFRGSR